MEFEKSSIERLKRTLYSRNEKVVPKEKRTPVSERKIDIPTDWGDNHSFGLSQDDMSKNNSFIKKFLFGSILFFFLSIAVASFIFFGGMNMISSNNVNMEITAPSSISSGEEMSFKLNILNGNRADLENVVLFIDYPIGALSITESKPLSRNRIEIGTIKSGDFFDFSDSLFLTGEKDNLKSFNLSIEYHIKGSNATFYKEKKYDVLINSSPIIINVDYPKEINSGQNLSLNLEIISNSNTIIKNTLVKVEYPYGFTYKDSNIKPLRDNSLWNIGDLKNGDKKILSINGILVGQNLEDRTFNISAGSEQSTRIEDFDIPLVTNSITVGIRKSFFDLSILANETSYFGYSNPITIRWENILPDKILNTKVTATISGNVFDKSKVEVSNGGFYRSSDSSIFWDKNSDKNLENIPPGDSGSVSFSVGSLPNTSQVKLIKNPNISINVKILGDRSGLETGQISSEENILIKFPSSVSFTSKTLHNTGPIVNSGNIPPKADKETTYTVFWAITNTNNDLKNVVIRAVLPFGVEWKNEISPLNEKISFNPETRTVTWNIGNLSSGVGFIYSPKEVYFKLGIIPSLNQVGTVPEILTDQKIDFFDTYIEKDGDLSIKNINTNSLEGGSNTDNGKVVK